MEHLELMSELTQKEREDINGGYAGFWEEISFDSEPKTIQDIVRQELEWYKKPVY